MALRTAYDQVLEQFLRTRAGGWMNLHVMTHIDTHLMRWSNGRFSTAVGSKLGPNAVLLRCTGAKSQQVRDIPVIATPFDDGWVLIASATGRTRNPAWFHNLKANPHCSLLLPTRQRVACVAREAAGAERHRAWLAANVQYTGYDTYQTRTQREIPVMILRPEDPPTTPR